MSLLRTLIEHTTPPSSPEPSQPSPSEPGWTDANEPSREQADSAKPEPAPVPSPAYFISTNLDARQTGRPEDYPRDLYIGENCYRRLDPPYFAYLRRLMEGARTRHEKGLLSQDAYNTLRKRFNRVQTWAIRLFGQEPLLAAYRQFSPRTYKPPVNHPPANFCYPRSGDWRFEHPVTREAIAKVDAIRDIALSLDWTPQHLYQNRGRFRFPLGQDYGLVCFVDHMSRLGQVTVTHIEIIHGRPGDEHSMKFMHPDRFPPRREELIQP